MVRIAGIIQMAPLHLFEPPYQTIIFLGSEEKPYETVYSSINWNLPMLE